MVQKAGYCQYGIVTFAEIELIDSGKLKNFGEFRLSVSIRLIAFSLVHLETQGYPDGIEIVKSYFFIFLKNRSCIT